MSRDKELMPIFCFICSKEEGIPGYFCMFHEAGLRVLLLKDDELVNKIKEATTKVEQKMLEKRFKK